MISDVVSPASYLTFNVTIAHIIGLVNAVYCSEILDIYNKARKKKKLDDDNFFVLNRDYIKARTSIKVDEQYLCDASLSKVGLVETSTNNPDKIRFDVTRFMQIIAEEDSKVLNQIYKKVTLAKNDKDSKALKKEKLKAQLKDAVSVENLKIANALKEWIDVVFESKNMIPETVQDFQTTLMNYAKTDVEKALRIITIAKVQTWTNCVYAIESYEKEQKVLSNSTSTRTTSFKVASSNNLSDKKY